ncbi:MAG: hypothetical protein ACT4NY_28480 [Pseudonocardiales bacterium]
MIRIDKGLPRPPQAKWILVDQPPRDRPKASPSTGLTDPVSIPLFYRLKDLVPGAASGPPPQPLVRSFHKIALITER